MTIDDTVPESLPKAQPPSRAERLAERLLADRAKAAKRPARNIAECFLCGRSYSVPTQIGDDSPSFCGNNCRNAYDNGFQKPEPFDPFAPGHWRVIAGPSPGYLPKSMRKGPHGFFVNCAQCKREFESKGLRCCSTECERALEGRKAAAATVAEVGGELTEKRKCVVCGAAMPNWVGTGKHRRLANKTKTTCSNRCRAKARKMGLPEGSNSSVEGPEPSEAIPSIFTPQTPPANIIGGYRFPDAPEVAP